MRYEDLYKVYAQRYSAKIGGSWYLITPTSLVALPEPVSGALSLELTELPDSWTTSKDYSLFAAQSIARQAQRLGDDIAILNKNLLAIRHQGKVRVYWADTQEKIDDDRLLALEQYSDRPYRAEKNRNYALQQAEKMIISHDWGRLGNRAAELVLAAPAGKLADIAADMRSSRIVTLERWLFENLFAAQQTEMGQKRLEGFVSNMKDVK